MRDTQFGKYTLHFGFNAMAKMEQVTINEGLESSNWAGTLIMFWGGALKHHNLTRDEAGDILDELVSGSDLETVSAELLEIFEASNPSADQKAKAEETADGGKPKEA